MSSLEATIGFPPPALESRTVTATVTWDDRDVLLYALSVGAGQRDPLTELELTTENTSASPLRVLPSFGVILVQDQLAVALEGIAESYTVVHAEIALRLRRPIPPAGSAAVRARVSSVFDKGSGAVVVSEATAADASSGEPLLEARSSYFVIGVGGFGGERGPSARRAMPTREPDRTLRAHVRTDQALLYRLNGDRNPLHTDPAVARSAGFDRPILHGLATYGIAARLLFHDYGGTAPSIAARFTAPVLPGTELAVDCWEHEGDVVFRARAADGTTVMDAGRFAA